MSDKAADMAFKIWDRGIPSPDRIAAAMREYAEYEWNRRTKTLPGWNRQSQTEQNKLGSSTGYGEQHGSKTAK